MHRQNMTTERLLMGLLLGGIGIGCIEVLYPFFSAILWAAILAFTTWPFYVWMRRHLHLGHTGTALLMVTIVAVVVVLPLAVAAPDGADDAKHLNALLQNAVAAGLPHGAGLARAGAAGRARPSPICGTPGPPTSARWWRSSSRISAWWRSSGCRCCWDLPTACWASCWR